MGAARGRSRPQRRSRKRDGRKTVSVYYVQIDEGIGWESISKHSVEQEALDEMAEIQRDDPDRPCRVHCEYIYPKRDDYD